MDVLKDDEIRLEMLERIKAKYLGKQRRPSDGIHLTMLIYCITLAAWRNLVEFKATDDEALLWASGLGLEEVILEDSSGTNRPEPRVVDGIMVSPDYIMLNDARLAELKTTRMYLNKEEEPTYGWPETWKKQMMGYCVGYGVKEYRLASYHLIPAKLIGRLFRFTQEELDSFWAEMMVRRVRLIEAVELKTIPEPFAYNAEWECKRCSALTLCEVSKQAGKYIPK